MPVIPLFQEPETWGAAVNAEIQELARVVAEARKRTGLTLEEIAKRGGPSVAWMSALARGKMYDAPKVATLKRLSVALGLPIDLLMHIVGYGAHGAGSASSQKHGNHDSAMVSGFVATSEDGQNHGAERILGENLGVAKGIQRPSEQLQPLTDADWITLPLLGAAACGEPIYATMEHATEPIPVLRREAEALGANAAFIIRGNSMSGMMLQDGDLVLVQMLDGRRPPNGKVVIVRTPDGLVAKQYRCDDVGEYLQEHELGHEPRRVRFDEGCLVAVVVYHGRRM